MKKKYDHVILISLLITSFNTGSAADYQVRIRVKADVLPVESQIYIAGNLSEFGEWQAEGLKLNRRPDTTWEAMLDLPEGTTMQFKITRGSWETEMVDIHGFELPNFNLVVRQDTTIEIVAHGWRDLSHVPTVISPERFRNKANQIELFENWKYHPGDISEWANPIYDDSSWPEVPTLLPADLVAQKGWPGVGWFRLHLEVDSLLLDIPLGMSLLQAGASEIYLNGKMLYRTGTIQTDSTTEQDSFSCEPLFIVFSDHKPNILAVRYSNVNGMQLFGPEKWTGFRIVLFASLADFIRGRLFDVRNLSLYQLIFTIIPMTLAFLHLMIFIFSRKKIANFYYAVSMTGFAVIAYTDFGFGFTASMAEALWLSRINFIAVNAAVIFGLLTIYRSSERNPPRIFYIILLFSAVLIIWFLIHTSPFLQTAFYVLLGLIAIELFRQSFRPIYEHNYIIGTGVLVLSITVILQIFINMDLIDSIAGSRTIYMYGVLALGVTMSINLAKNFAEINQKIIRQAREKREAEIQQRLLEADNQRKTVELEEARKLQLSMLPSGIPLHPEYDVAMVMRTASEVGGDYYDYQIDTDKTMTIALGDATGHGIKAGIMVTLVKSLFNTSANTFYLPDFFKRCTGMIRQMNFGNLFMALMLVRLRQNKMMLSIAGMPPVYIHRAAQNSIEEFVQKALPLGGPEGSAYTQQSIILNSGDTILMMTDGFYELFNPEGQMLDLERVKSFFQAFATKSPAEIITNLMTQADNWRQDAPQGDDITFIVIRKK